MGYSNDNFWKLDKWDKIGIASLILFFTIFVVLNTFSFGSEVPSGYIEVFKTGILDYTFNGGTDTIFGFPNTSLYYYDLTGTDYIILNGSTNNLSIAFTKEMPGPDVEIFSYERILVDGSTTFNLSDSDFKYLVVTNTNVNTDFSVYKSFDGFSDVSSMLVSSVGFDIIFDTFIIAIPYILIVVLVAFGIYLISHAIREISKGRDV